MTWLAVGLVGVGLVISSACGGGEDRPEVEFLTGELREVHAATIAAYERLATLAAERSAAQLARTEAGTPAVSRLTDRAAREAEEWAARINTLKTNHASVLTQLEDAAARGTWDLHFPIESGAGLSARAIVGSVVAAAEADRDRVQALVASRDADTTGPADRP